MNDNEDRQARWINIEPTGATLGRYSQLREGKPESQVERCRDTPRRGQTTGRVGATSAILRLFFVLTTFASVDYHRPALRSSASTGGRLIGRHGASSPLRRVFQDTTQPAVTTKSRPELGEISN